MIYNFYEPLLQHNDNPKMYLPSPPADNKSDYN